MALLNYALTLAEVQSYLNLTPPKTAQDNHVGEFAKIIFTGEGDIITHGYNYTQIFGEHKGLVPKATHLEGEKLKFLANNVSWRELTVADLPMAAAPADASATTLFTSKQIVDYFATQLSAVDAMRFKGGIYADDDTSFPTKAEIGDTYRVIVGGEYAEQRVEAGDLLICIADNLSGAGTINKKANWVVVQSNINGTIEHSINGTGYKVYSPNINQDTQSFTIYAPTTGGFENYILVAQGENATPKWQHANTIVEQLTQGAFGKAIVTDVAITADGTLNVTYYNSASNTSEKLGGRWDIHISGSAGKVDNALTLGTGFRFATGENYDGSAARQILMTPATGTNIGGVIIDNLGNHGGLKKTEGDTISITENGNIYLTDQNIFNALGYKPGNTAAVFAYANILTNSSTSYTPANTINPYFNLTAAAEDGSSTKVASFLQFIGTNGIKISSNDKILNFDLQLATDAMRGGIKVGYTSNNAARKYAVELDENEQAFVHVDWKDESYAFSAIDVISGGNTKSIVSNQVADKFSLQAGTGMTLDTDTANKKITINNKYWEVVNTTNEMGYAPKLIMTNTEKLSAGHYMLAFKNGDTNPSWYTLPITALSDSWRAVKVNGTQVLDNTVRTDNATGTITGLALDLRHGGKTTITDAGNGAVLISSTWRDIKVNDNSIHENASFNIQPTNEIGISQIEATETEHSIGFKILWTNLSTGGTETIV